MAVVAGNLGTEELVLFWNAQASAPVPQPGEATARLLGGGEHGATVLPEAHKHNGMVLGEVAGWPYQEQRGIQVA